MKNKTLQSIVEEYFEAEGLKECFYVSDRITGNRVEVFLDSDDGISFAICRKVSRVIEAILDETKEYGEAYTLEVSSAGVGTPLVMPRQYIKNIGRGIEVKHDDTKTVGELKSADQEKITVQYEETIKEGKKKRIEIILKELAYIDIASAKIKISFKK